MLLQSFQGCTRGDDHQRTGCCCCTRRQGMSCRSSALIGLIDDVDCAVVSLTRTGDPGSPFQLQHVASIPALAYVATGMPDLPELPVGCISRHIVQSTSGTSAASTPARASVKCKSTATFPWFLKAPRCSLYIRRAVCLQARLRGSSHFWEGPVAAQLQSLWRPTDLPMFTTRLLQIRPMAPIRHAATLLHTVLLLLCCRHCPMCVHHSQ
jgi:hypothetical protein